MAAAILSDGASLMAKTLGRCAYRGVPFQQQSSNGRPAYLRLALSLFTEAEHMNIRARRTATILSGVAIGIGLFASQFLAEPDEPAQQPTGWTLTIDGAGGAPRVARHGDELVFAWAEGSGGTSQVRTASAHVPSSMAR